MPKPVADIFCDVVDNYGDAGVVYRLVRACVAKGIFSSVRLFTNDVTLFSMLDPAICPDAFSQRVDGVDYFDLRRLTPSTLAVLPPPLVIIETFGCMVPEFYLEHMDSAAPRKLMLNIEYLTAESWAADFHMKRSPIGLKNIDKFFFMPGFTQETGGLIIDSAFMNSLPDVQNERSLHLDPFLAPFGLAHEEGLHRVGLLFCYDRDLAPLLDACAALRDRPMRLFVTGEKSIVSVQRWVDSKGLCVNDGLVLAGGLQLLYLPFIPQERFDLLIALMDFAFVRGEDSPVRALLAGVPSIWQRYPQSQGVCEEKLEAYLSLFEPWFTDEECFAQYAGFMRCWNRAGNEGDLAARMDFLLANREMIHTATAQFSKFVAARCNLIEKLSETIQTYLTKGVSAWV